ncbi:MAG: hypothetical protein V2B18_25470 [Pseudomonadota bacterium]
MIPGRAGALVSCVLMASVACVALCQAQDVGLCGHIKSHLLKIDQISIYTFGKERDDKIAEAQTEFRNLLTKSNYALSAQLEELVNKYVSLTAYGHDRMRKGDSRLLVMARETQDKIKALCPWD